MRKVNNKLLVFDRMKVKWLDSIINGNQSVIQKDNSGE